MGEPNSADKPSNLPLSPADQVREDIRELRKIWQDKHPEFRDYDINAAGQTFQTYMNSPRSEPGTATLLGHFGLQPEYGNNSLNFHYIPLDWLQTARAVLTAATEGQELDIQEQHAKDAILEKIAAREAEILGYREGVQQVDDFSEPEWKEVQQHLEKPKRSTARLLVYAAILDFSRTARGIAKYYNQTLEQLLTHEGLTPSVRAILQMVNPKAQEDDPLKDFDRRKKELEDYAQIPCVRMQEIALFRIAHPTIQVDTNAHSQWNYAKFALERGDANIGQINRFWAMACMRICEPNKPIWGPKLVKEDVLAQLNNAIEEAEQRQEWPTYIQLKAAQKILSAEKVSFTDLGIELADRWGEPEYLYKTPDIIQPQELA